MLTSDYISISPVHFTRVGQVLNYIAAKYVPYLYFTKLVKLLFLIDEESVKLYGVPITWLEYNVFDKGPLPGRLWLNIPKGDNDFLDFISVQEDEYGYKVLPNGKYELSEFTNFEISTIDATLEKYGQYSVEELIEITHREDGLWSKLVKEKNIEFTESDASPYIIDFRDLIKKEKIKLHRFDMAIREIKFLESHI